MYEVKLYINYPTLLEDVTKRIKIYSLIKMQRASQRVDVTICEKKDPPHPCDSPLPCDPSKEDEGNCPDPFLCLERVKNPAFSGEITKCKPGRFMNVKSCEEKEDPPHACDPPLPCSKTKTQPCNDPALCIHRIKNPEEKKEDDNSDCDPSN